MERAHFPPGVNDFAHGAPTDASPLTQSAQQPQSTHFNEDVNYEQQEPSTIDDGHGNHMQRSDSVMSQSQTLTPSRGGTLKKKQSLKRSGSMKRTLSKKDGRPGSVRSLALGDKEKYASGEGDEMNSVFFTPVPTTGNPTEILANRFQAWRKVLKDLITYFRDIQKSYEARSKSLLGVSNVINNITAPPPFLPEGGFSEATRILRDYHRQSLAAGNKAKSIEEDVIVQLTGLRSDLQQKVKEIKNLAGDFKNNVERETEGTRRAVRDLQEALGLVDLEPSATTGKGDPFIVRLGVERQIERQIDEENYLHRAFLNLENSGRELESIVVGEIQKAYNAYAGILKREADEAYETVESLRNGPIAMAKDHEWDAFVQGNEHFVDPKLPVRNVEHIFYPGKDSPAASEVRAGMLERKSKYLKSYTPGWYVLSPTHLHEFKSADRINSQQPIMSLYLPEQRLGSRSSADSSSHKFMLKGRQTGGMHRGHAWVFRAESLDTMQAWYEDIRVLTEKSGEERNAFVRRHARSVSGGSQKPGSISSDGAMDEDEADKVPYSAASSTMDQAVLQEQKLPERPQPGGRFPSELNVNRDLHVPLSPSSGTSSDDREIVAAATALPGSGVPFGQSSHAVQKGGDETNIRGGAAQWSEPGINHIAEVAGPSELAAHPDKSMQRYGEDEISRNGNAPPEVTPYRESYVPIGQMQEYRNLPVHDGPNPNTSPSAAKHPHPDQNDQITNRAAVASGNPGAENLNQRVHSQGVSSDGPGAVAYAMPSTQPQDRPQDLSGRSLSSVMRHHGETSNDSVAPAAAGVGGATLAAAGAHAYHQHQQHQQQKNLGNAEQTTTFPSQSTANPAGAPRNADFIGFTNPPSEISHYESFNTPSASTMVAEPTADNLDRPRSAESAVSGLSLASTVDDNAAGEAQTRPTLEHHMSVQTISDLHIPGEYPHASVRPGA